MNKNWSLALLPDLTGKTAFITGANAGLGFKSALEIARQGAEVIIACRSVSKGEAAIERIQAEVPQAKLDVIPLDLADLASVVQFVEQFYQQRQQLDLLMNNAGVVNLPSLQHTPSGQEMHMATNHLGHFALTGLLMDALLRAPQARVVTLSSGGYKFGTIDFDDFSWRQRPYHPMKAYGDSKLANLLFTLELQQYFVDKGSKALSVAAHPGLTGTERQQSIGMGGWLTHSLAVPVAKGVRPQLMAVTSPHVIPAGFYGPKFALWGAPALQKLKPEVLEQSRRQRLWRYSEVLSGVQFP